MVSFNRYLPATAETILSSITDGFVALDADWRYTYINPQAELILRRSAAETLGRIVWDLYPETVGTTVQWQFERARANQHKETFEFYNERLKIWFSIAVYPTD